MPTTGSLFCLAMLGSNPTLPDGTRNPNFNQLDTEFLHRIFVNQGPEHSVRITATFDLKFPFVTQKDRRERGLSGHRGGGENYSAFVDPGGSSFSETLVSAHTLAPSWGDGRSLQFAASFFV